MSAEPPQGVDALSVQNHKLGSIIFTVGNLVLAFFTGITMFGIITGIIAIVFATQVNSRLQSGNRAGARDAARVTKVFYWITLVIFAVGVILFIVLFFLVLASLFTLSAV
jgi:hypothetical protein